MSMARPHVDPAEPAAGDGSPALQPLAMALGEGGSADRAWRWHTRASRKRQVVMVHGLGEHGRALPCQRLAEPIVDAGFALWSCDLPGHGDVAPAARGRCRLTDLLDHLHSLLAHLRAASPQAPVQLVGFSMGAVVALLAAQRWPALVAGVVAGALPLGRIEASRLSLLAATWLGRLLPNLRVRSGIDLDRVADDAEAVRRYRSDPLLHDCVGLGLGADLLAARRLLPALLQRPPCPTLVLHGGRDRIAPWDAAADAAMAGAGSRIERLPHGGHNLLLDRQRDAAIAAVLGWLAEHEDGGGC